MDATRPPLPRITPIGSDPVRLSDDDTDAALRDDLRASRAAVVIGIDFATIQEQLLALVAGSPRDACG